MAAPETIVTNRDRLADALLTTDGQPAYPGMPQRHQLADTVVNGFSPTRCRRCVLKASPRRATFFPAGDSAFQRQIL
jgi:predicted component of type VI protein secretion system